ncbi:enoyl-CoA hydratase/isomerase family protein [Aldersonia sp. NBC_00410]|uniref:enoyl-CoA hydratase/isomerase family protein n=1 Tax=Aldersonia sp. NBC_00410 TaxID=2975954 RepID=UPI002251DF96|nr:enoyl-CoA hydratase/isomerase family protein [Aldersonia sp. NBC_00410]MCX5045670.1 enoyl-CoA hydratase/isomerase family protein [Aldersonia sp. NBC_00410]
MPYLERHDEVFVLYLGSEGQRDSENRFNPQWVSEVADLLDEVAASTGPAALVTTATGKYYSTGADLSWGMDNLDRVNSFIDGLQELYARVLSLPMQTIAAIQGHTFGAAAFWVMTHDYRIMRRDRGYLCFPGVNIGAAYSPGTVDMVGARLPSKAFHEALTTGRRYGGAQAIDLGLVDEIAEQDDLLDRAIERASSLSGTRGDSLGQIKATMYARVLDGLRVPVSGVESQEWSARN